MNSISGRMRHNIRSGGFAMMAAGIAAAFLFVVATLVVGYDTAAKDQRFARVGESITKTHTQSVPATAGR